MASYFIEYKLQNGNTQAVISDIPNKELALKKFKANKPANAANAVTAILWRDHSNTQTSYQVAIRQFK